MISIDTDVPVPAPRNRKAGDKYPWRSMKIGDSFFIAGMTRNHAGSRVAYANQLGIGRFTLRSVEGGVRVWRVA